MSEPVRLEHVDYEHPDAVLLRAEQYAFGNALYADHPASVNRSGSEGMDPASIVHTVVAYLGDEPVGHVCLRRMDGPMDGELELKRMFVREGHRGAGIADALLDDVEQAARATGAPRVVIHTGDRQVAALRFYERHGYTPIDVYWPYQDVTYSLCFEKRLSERTE